MAVCGFTFSDSSYVIQAHVLGMYAPAFITGHLITRYGVNNILIVGAALRGASIVIHLWGITFLNFLSGWSSWVWAGTFCSPAVPRC